LSIIEKLMSMQQYRCTSDITPMETASMNARSILNTALCGLMLAGSTAALATYSDNNTFQRGPAPTTASLEAAAGPFQVGSQVLASPVGYKGGTVFYPSNASGPFALVVFAPGLIETQSWNAWWGQYLASHGFVVVNIDTMSMLELPSARAREELAALKDVIRRSNLPESPFYGLVDPNRLGAMGHSMGGGASLELARDNPMLLKAIVPMAPYLTGSKDFSSLNIPTMVLACKGDIIATANAQSEPVYKSLAPGLDKAYMELASGGGHPCTTSLGTSPQVKTMAAKYGVSWLKRFLDQDTRYSPFLCGAPHLLDMTSSVVSGYKGNCPY
jgi:dienelactone hydrolase